jgi:hypothetical protein
VALALSGCGGSSNTTSPTSTPSIAAPANNVQPISVNPGPAGDYANGLFTSVTVCVPGTSNCQTIDGVLVDTGSSGLRLLGSVLSLALPPSTNASGAQLAECAQFQDSTEWGSVVRADVKLAGEVAPNLPVNVLAPAGFPAIPSQCAQPGLPVESTVADLGANGILGVGLFREDCGPGCAATGSSNPGLYYACAAGACQPVAVTLDQQVQNPVWRFTTDNNGVVIQLPTIPALGATSVAGSMVFGIGTQANNALGGASVLTVDGVGDITTVFQNRSYADSFIDSGSNAIFFLDSATTGLATCRGSADFYCPVGAVNLTATNRGGTGTSSNVSFSISSADTLFNTPNFAFGNLGGPNAGAFDWGLPFFFGRNVYTAIESQPTPAGLGPYFAY